MRRPWAGLLLTLPVLAAAHCSTTIELPDRRALRAGETLVVQALHRSARRSDGSLRADAAQVMADAVLAALTGAPPPLEPWSHFAGRRGAATVIAMPTAGPVSDAAHLRLSTIAEPGAEVRLVEGLPFSRPTDARQSVILVLRPGWKAGGLEVDPEAEWGALTEAGWPLPSLTLVDLLEPQIDGEIWRADEVLASRSMQSAAVAARWILASRARGGPADAGALASARGLSLGDLEWIRLAIAR